MNAKSAKAFGYGKLGKINRYAKGGKVQKFQDGGQAFGPTRTEASGFSVDFSNVIREYSVSIGKSEAEVNRFAKGLRDADHDMDEVSKSMKGMTKANNAGAKQGVTSDKREQIFGHQQDRLKKKGGGADFSMTGIAVSDGKKGMSTEELNKKLDKTGNKVESFGSKLGKINPLSLMLGFQVASGIAQSFGLELNSASIESRSGLLALGAAAVVGKKQMRSFGSMLSKTGRKSGSTLLKTMTQGARIAIGKFAGALAKSGPLIFLELGNMITEALFSTDWNKEAEKQKALGNATKAAEATMNEFTQAQLSAIPLVGGFLNVLADWVPGGTFARNLIFGGKDARDAASMVGGQVESDNNQKDLDASIGSLELALKRSSPGESLKEIDSAAGAVNQSAKKAFDLLESRARALSGTAAKNINRGMFAFGSGRTDDNIKRQDVELASIKEDLSAVTGSYSKSIEMMQGTMTNFANDIVLSGGDLSDVRKKMAEELPELSKEVIDLIGDPEKLREQGDRVSNVEMMLAKDEQKMKKLSQTRSAEGKRMDHNLKMEKQSTEAAILSTKVQLSKLKAEQQTAEAIMKNVNTTILFKQSMDRLNESYKEQTRVMKLLQNELGEFERKVRDLDLARELSATGIGAAGPKAIAKSMGTDVLQGSFAQIERAGASDKLVEQGFKFGGEATGQQLETAVKMQKAMEGLLEGGLADEGFKKITDKAIKQRGQTDPKLAEAFTEDIESFLEKKVFGDKGVPSAFKNRFKQFAAEFGQQISETGGADLGKLKEMTDKFVQEAGGNSKKLIQGILDKQASGLAELGQMYAKLNQMELDFAMKRAEQARNAQQAINDIEQQRIDQLESMGVNPEGIRKERKDLARKRQKEALDRVSGQFGAGRGVKNFKDLQREGEKAREKLKRANENLLKSRKDAPSPDPGDFDTGAGRQRADAKELAMREKMTANLRNQIAAAKDYMSARKQEIDLMIKETNARRESIQAFRDATGDLINDFAFGTDEARQDLLGAANLTVKAMSQGSMRGFTGEQRGAVGSFLDRFSGIDMALPAFGGKTAARAKGELAAREAIDAGIIRPDQFQDFASRAAKEALPMDKKVEAAIREALDKFYAEQTKIQREINKDEQAIVDSQEVEMEKFRTSIVTFESAVRQFFERSQSKVEPITIKPSESQKKAEASTSDLANEFKNNRNATGGPLRGRELTEQEKETLGPTGKSNPLNPINSTLAPYSPQLGPDLSRRPSVNTGDTPSGKKLLSMMEGPQGPQSQEEALKTGKTLLGWLKNPLSKGTTNTQTPPLSERPVGFTGGLTPSVKPKTGREILKDIQSPDATRYGFGPQGPQGTLGTPGTQGPQGPQGGPPSKAELSVDIGHQQLTLNIPQLMAMTNDALTGVAMKKISAVLTDFVNELDPNLSTNGIHQAMIAAIDAHGTEAPDPTSSTA